MDPLVPISLLTGLLIIVTLAICTGNTGIGFLDSAIKKLVKKSWAAMWSWDPYTKESVPEANRPRKSERWKFWAFYYGLCVIEFILFIGMSYGLHNEHPWLGVLTLVLFIVIGVITVVLLGF